MDTAQEELTAEQIIELIEVVKRVHGFDFSDYTKASLKRRIARIMMMKKAGFNSLKQMLVNEQPFFQEFLEEITVNVTEMFRDPTFFKALNSEVLPLLSACDHIKIWSAGCSTGEEPYSLAILLQKAGLKQRSLIYGTDINTVVIKEAREGIYSYRNIKNYAENYMLSGLGGSITDYFKVVNDKATVSDDLKVNTRFLVQNLISGANFNDDLKVNHRFLVQNSASGANFNEFQLISCRNVFIYFETLLQEKILDLFYHSLRPNGFLCLGSKETIRSDIFKTKFRPFNQKENIYQKIE